MNKTMQYEKLDGLPQPSDSAVNNEEKVER
jgi:hypothetical protein